LAHGGVSSQKSLARTRRCLQARGVLFASRYTYALHHGVHVLRLETGTYQPEAKRLYERYGFQRIPPFGDYEEGPFHLFYEKHIP
jgi:putative acetyltransferase